jgi:hypothetical protein
MKTLWILLMTFVWLSVWVSGAQAQSGELFGQLGL